MGKKAEISALKCKFLIVFLFELHITDKEIRLREFHSYEFIVLPLILNESCLSRTFLFLLAANSIGNKNKFKEFLGKLSKKFREQLKHL